MLRSLQKEGSGLAEVLYCVEPGDQGEGYVPEEDQRTDHTHRQFERSTHITKEFRVQARDDGKRHRAGPDTIQGVTEVTEARWWL